MIKEKIEELRRLQEAERPNNVEVIKNLQQELSYLLEQEDMRWRQRTKSNWYKLGDRNTRYFHLCANQRKKRNFISQVRDSHSVLRRDRGEIQ